MNNDEHTLILTDRIKMALEFLHQARPEISAEFRLLAGFPSLVVFWYDKNPRFEGARLTNVSKMRFNTVPELLHWVRSSTASAPEEETMTLPRIEYRA